MGVSLATHQWLPDDARPSRYAVGDAEPCATGTGLNIQVVCDLVGGLRWISDPVEGCRHDSAALRGSAVLDGVDTQNWIGDKGYIGLGMLTPIRKPPHRELLDWEKEFNTAINKIRWRIE